MKKSEKLALIANGISLAVCVGLNWRFGSEIWPWYVHAFIWFMVAGPIYLGLMIGEGLTRAVDGDRQ